MNNKYRILFCRRNPKDEGWLYKLTPKASFRKTFSSLEDAAKFISDNVYIPSQKNSEPINPDSKIVVWSVSHLKRSELNILWNKIDAMCRKKVC